MQAVPLFPGKSSNTKAENTAELGGMAQLLSWIHHHIYCVISPPYQQSQSLIRVNKLMCQFLWLSKAH